MSEGFTYRKNLEAARKALLDRAGSRYKTAEASEQVEVQKEGLMRPKSRPPVDESTSLADGLGLAMMDLSLIHISEPTRPY